MPAFVGSGIIGGQTDLVIREIDNIIFLVVFDSGGTASLSGVAASIVSPCLFALAVTYREHAMSEENNFSFEHMR
jgi:hypothetical protein